MLVSRTSSTLFTVDRVMASPLKNGGDLRPPWHVTAPQWLEQGSWELENQFTTARPMATNGMAEACTTNKAPRFVAQAACHFTRRTRTPTLWVETRLTCPPTSRIVQWIPVQLEGYNKGMEAG